MLLLGNKINELIKDKACVGMLFIVYSVRRYASIQSLGILLLAQSSTVQRVNRVQPLRQRAAERFLMQLATLVDRFDVDSPKFLLNNDPWDLVLISHLEFHVDLREDGTMSGLAAWTIEPINCGIPEQGASSSRCINLLLGGRSYIFPAALPVRVLRKGPSAQRKLCLALSLELGRADI